jgi:CRISPR-associated protein Csb3
VSAAWEPNIRIRVDVTNPGQFFACCGLLEMIDRLSPGAEACFEVGRFAVQADVGLEDAVSKIVAVEMNPTDPEDATASPIHIGAPFNLRLDWWKTEDRGSLGLKVWAGKMESYRIGRAMQRAMGGIEFQSDNLLNIGAVAYDPDDLQNKVEPFYFDARRGPNAHSRDVGFSVNDLGITTTASPAVELLCLVGLQRCQPMPTELPRIYDYHTWSTPVSASLLPGAVAGLFGSGEGYQFESWYRTSQRKHKAFLRANPKIIKP